MFRFLGKFFGYKDGSSYAKVLWRGSATCLAVLLALFTGCLLYAFTTEVVISKWISPSLNPEWESQRISNRVVFQKNKGHTDYGFSKHHWSLAKYHWIECKVSKDTWDFHIGYISKSVSFSVCYFFFSCSSANHLSPHCRTIIPLSSPDIILVVP